MSTNLQDWEHRVTEMQKCNQIADLLARPGEPPHKVQQSGFEIWQHFRDGQHIVTVRHWGHHLVEDESGGGLDVFFPAVKNSPVGFSPGCHTSRCSLRANSKNARGNACVKDWLVADGPAHVR